MGLIKKLEKLDTEMKLTLSVFLPALISSHFISKRSANQALKKGESVGVKGFFDEVLIWSANVLKSNAIMKNGWSGLKTITRGFEKRRSCWFLRTQKPCSKMCIFSV